MNPVDIFSLLAIADRPAEPEITLRQRMDGLNYILLKKRKTSFGNSKNTPGSKAGCEPRAVNPKGRAGRR